MGSSSGPLTVYVTAPGREGYGAPVTTDMERYGDLVLAAETGRRLVASGQLQYLRHKLGFSRSDMADLLGCSVLLYRDWEAGRVPSDSDARRILIFHDHAWALIRQLESENVVLAGYRPLSRAAQYCGVSRQEMYHRYLDEEFPDALDLGLFGIWLPKERGRR